MTDPFDFSLWDKGKGLHRATSLNVGKTPSEVKRKVGRVNELRGTSRPAPVKSSIDDLLGLFDAPDAVQSTPPIEIRRELTPTHAPTLSATAEIALNQGEEDDDDFGEFVDSPVMSQGSTFTSPVVPTGATFASPQLAATSLQQPFTTPQVPVQAQPATAPLPSVPRTSTSSIDLLGSSPVSTLTDHAPPPPSSSLPALVRATPGLSTTVPQTTISVLEDDDDDFGDFISTPTASSAPPLPSSAPSQTATKGQPTAPAPVPIPPPHILLSLLLRTVLFLPTDFFTSLAKLQYPLRRRVLADTRTKQYFAALMEGARIAARIVAGRYRYHSRHTNLKTGESGRERKRERREERDLADLEARRVEAEWDRMKPRLRAVIGGMGLVLPEVKGENIVGDLHAKGKGRPPTEVCAVCGVGRRERLAGIEGQQGGGVKDWKEREGVTGHTGCVNWWVSVRDEA
ncbi:40S ribosomal protein S3 [Saitoella coloradoensis]